MKRNAIIISILILVIGLITISTKILQEKKQEKDFINYKVDLTKLNLDIIEKEDCIKEKILYYESDGIKYYTSCIDKIIDNNNMDLKKLLDSNKITFEDIFSTYDKEVTSYCDGGSKEYYFENLNIIKCHTLDGNTDVTIGNNVTVINEGYCGDRLDEEYVIPCMFKKIYKIKEKEGKIDSEYSNVLLEENNKEPETIKIKTYYYNQIKENESYTFIFENNKEYAKDKTITDIFNNYELGTILDTKEEHQEVCLPVSREFLKKAYNFLNKEEQKDIDNLMLSEVTYLDAKKLTYYDKNKKSKSLKNKELIIVKFKNVDESKSSIKKVIADFNTKEILGTIK